MIDIHEFKEPGKKYRSIPFWGWNDRLEEKEIINQIHKMSQAGLGGFFMHSREGLETPYLSDEWKKMIITAVNESKKLGMEAWLYDEDRWPSGNAGGAVPKQIGSNAGCKGLTLEVYGTDNQNWKYDPSIIALFAAKVEEMEIYSLRPLNKGEEPHINEKCLALRIEVSGKSPWFNNQPPPNHLDKQAVHLFLQITHETYAKIIGSHFGQTVPGIFTDEPSLHDRHASFAPNRGWIPWTDDFIDYFIQHRGYNPIETIAYIFFNGKHSSKIRHDYWRTVAECFTERFSGSISRWCKEHHISYTGHFLQEDKLGLSTRVNGGSIMLHYRCQDVPGIDMLCERTNEYLTVKQCSSIAHQYGKPIVLSESYGCTGWDFSMEAQKWIGDWQYALGVNRLSKHIALYSLRGCRKRDYPPSFNCNTTWWNHAKVIEDYFARVSVMLSMGKSVQDVLVIHPQSTAWSRLGCSPYGNPIRRNERDVPAIDTYGFEFNKLLRYLSAIHYDYDLGDELLMMQDAVISEKCFHIQQGKYYAVILPQVDTLLASTVELLEKWMQSGGTVIALGELPAQIEGEDNPSIIRRLSHPNLHQVSRYIEIEPILKTLLPRRISIIDDYGREDADILYQLKDSNDFWILFLSNNDRNKAHPVEISLNLEMGDIIYRMDPLNGESYYQEHLKGIFSEIIEESGSRLYYIEKSRDSEKICAKTFPKYISASKKFLTSFSPECRVSRNMPNALVLDKCQWSINEGSRSAVMGVWQAQEQVRQSLEMQSVAHHGITQRYLWADMPTSKDGTFVTFTYHFQAFYPVENVNLLIEDAEQFLISVNNEEICTHTVGTFLDPSFDLVPLPKLKAGENTISISCHYKNRTEIEEIYLLGDFGVSRSRVIVPESEIISTGDWTLQGYPFYCGSLTYHYSYQYNPSLEGDIILELPQFTATLVCLRINGCEKKIPWKAAAQILITDMLHEGENTIDVEVVSSPRNLLGPFHLAEGKPLNTNDEAFRATGPLSVEGYHLCQYGLYFPPKLFLV